MIRRKIFDLPCALIAISMLALMVVAVGNVYLLKIGAKSFGDEIQDIFKDTESNLGPFCGF